MRWISLILVLAATQVSAQSRAITSLTGGGTVRVEGFGSIGTAPTFARFSAGVSTRAARADDALARNNAVVAAVIAAARDFGVADEDLRTINFSVFPQTSNDGQAVVAYQVRNHVSIRTPDLGRLGELLDALIDAGATDVTGLSFGVDESGALRDQALAQAVDDAAAKAIALATAAGVELGAPISIDTLHQGVAFASDVAFSEGASRVPIEFGQNQISARVVVVYSILR